MVTTTTSKITFEPKMIAVAKIVYPNVLLASDIPSDDPWDLINLNPDQMNAKTIIGIEIKVTAFKIIINNCSILSISSPTGLVIGQKSSSHSMSAKSMIGKKKKNKIISIFLLIFFIYKLYQLFILFQYFLYVIMFFMQIDNLNKKKYIKDNPDYIANHYGFDFLNIEEKVFKKNVLVEDEKLKVLKNFKTTIQGKRSVPMKMFFYKKPIIKKEGGLGIDIINMESAIAEAAVIRTAFSILSEEGYSNFSIVLNAIGDKESQKNYKTALTDYYKKNKDKLKGYWVKKNH